MQRAEDAHHAAAEKHEDLARVHERTANTYQRAAMQASAGPADQLQAKADKHWQAAQDSHLRALADEALAVEDAARASDTKPG